MFGVSGVGIMDIGMRVSGRGGEVIFSTDTVAMRWDGTRNGGLVPDGVRVVWLCLRDAPNIKREHFGQLALMR